MKTPRATKTAKLTPVSDPMVARCRCIVACKGECRRPAVQPASVWAAVDALSAPAVPTR